MTRVLHVVLSLETGGLERVVLDLIEYRNKNMIEPYICCMNILGELGENYLKINPVPVFVLNKLPGIKLKIIKNIIDIIKLNKIDVVHTHNVAAHFYGAMAAFLSGKPVIHTKHGRNNPADNGEKLLSYISSLFTERVCTVSEDASKVCVDIEHINPKKITIVKNGIDVNKYNRNRVRSDLRNEYKIDRDNYICATVARLSEEKDHFTLVRAFHILHQKKCEVKLLIIGDGPLREAIKALIISLKLEDVVYLLGLRHDIPEILHQADLFLLSSVTEGIPITLLEAMASGLPIIATSVGGNAEIVCDGLNGYLVPPGDPERFSEKITEMIRNPDSMVNMGSAGRERAMNMFNISETVRKYEEIYRDVIRIA